MAEMEELPPSVKIGSFALTRLNEDSSWLIEYDHTDSVTNTSTTSPSCTDSVTTGVACSAFTRIILDPWFDDSPGVDGCACFSATWPNMETSVSLNAFQKENTKSATSNISSIIVSLPFSDHCHEATLLQMPSGISIFAANGSYGRIKRYLQKHDANTNRVVIDLSTESGVEKFTSLNGGLHFQSISSKFGKLDPTHRGIQFTDTKNKCTIIYAPHGLRLSAKKVQALKKNLSSICLLSTTKLFQLPFLLGGTVNLGFDSSLNLARSLNATVFIPTHSSVKGKVTGFVTFLSNVRGVEDNVVADRISSFRLALPPNNKKKANNNLEEIFHDNTSLYE